jgi:Na+/H+ antiporter NhaC
MEDYGVLSILPPALSVILAVYTRNIIFSLTLGAFSGALVLSNYNPFLAIAEFVETHAFPQLSIASNNQVLVVTLSIGGFIFMLDKSGGGTCLCDRDGEIYWQSCKGANGSMGNRIKRIFL